MRVTCMVLTMFLANALTATPARGQDVAVDGVGGIVDTLVALIKTEIDCTNAIMCTMIYAPVCASDGHTYGNSCEFRSALCKLPRWKRVGLKIVKDGECGHESVTPDCALIKCSNIGAGVCGSDGKTYANACQVTVAKCSNPSLVQVSEGPCPPSAVTPTITPVDSPAPAPPADAPLGCSVVRCGQFTECRVDPRTGKGYCADICHPDRCAASETCVLTQVQCFTTPCDPIATCVAKETLK